MNGEPDEEAAEAKGDAMAPRPAMSIRAIATAVLLTAVATAALIWGLRGSPPAPGLKKFELRPVDLQVGDAMTPAISPDATKLVYVRDGKLFLRDLRQVEDLEIPDSMGAVKPCWSPGSDSIAYVREVSLWKYSLASGRSTLISSNVGMFSAAGGLGWGTDDLLVFSRGGSGLLQVSARGGEPHEILAIDTETEDDLHQPRFLPEGRGLLYVAHRIETGPDTLKVLSGGEARIVMQQPSQILWNPVYSPTGHILYTRRTTNIGLWAVPFSLERLETTGEPFLVDREGSDPSVADDGTLFYVRGAGASTQQLVWINLQGEMGEAIGQPQAAMMKPSISPDGRRVAVMGLENESWDIWVHDATRGTRTRLTFDPRREWDPVWTPDGGNIIFWDGTTRALSIKAADGTGDTRRLFTWEFPDSGVPHLSPDGRSMVFWGRAPDGEEDIWIVSLEGEDDPVPLIATPAQEEQPRISPDGRFLVYASNESARFEVYLTRFPEVKSGKWQVSSNGGTQPRWGANGKTIYYRQGGAIMAADLSGEPAVQIGTPRELYAGKFPGVTVLNSGGFDVAPDGSRMVMIQAIVPVGKAPALIVVQNWASEFEQSD
jgi:Tol biopolymer transport system component